VNILQRFHSQKCAMYAGWTAVNSIQQFDSLTPRTTNSQL